MSLHDDDVAAGLARINTLHDLMAGTIAADPSLVTAIGGAHWLDYWSQLLAIRTGANPLVWHCPWSSDFVGGSGTDRYQENLVSNGTNEVVAGPGVRSFRCATGANAASAQSGFTSVGTSGAALVPTTKNGWVIESCKFRRWAFLSRFQTPTINANNNFTQMVMGIRDNTGLFMGFGAVSFLSPSVLSFLKGSTTTPNVLGDGGFSTKPALPLAGQTSNYFWGAIWHDIDHGFVYGSIDGEAPVIICATSALNDSPAYAYGVNAPAGGVVDETLWVDKAAVFTDL